MNSAETHQQIVEMLRTEGHLVEKYLDYARRYAVAVTDHAEALASELWPWSYTKTRLLASIPLNKGTPAELRQKLETIKARAVVTQVFVCPATMVIYVFGPNDQSAPTAT